MSENKSGTDSTETENPQKKLVKKSLNHRQINQDQVHKLKQNGQRNKILKKKIQLPSSDDIKL